MGGTSRAVLQAQGRHRDLLQQPSRAVGSPLRRPQGALSSPGSCGMECEGFSDLSPFLETPAADPEVHNTTLVCLECCFFKKT